jgi:hypothetical protein
MAKHDQLAVWYRILHRLIGPRSGSVIAAPTVPTRTGTSSIMADGVSGLQASACPMLYSLAVKQAH